MKLQIHPKIKRAIMNGDRMVASTACGTTTYEQQVELAIELVRRWNNHEFEDFSNAPEVGQITWDCCEDCALWSDDGCAVFQAEPPQCPLQFDLKYQRVVCIRKVSR